MSASSSCLEWVNNRMLIKRIQFIALNYLKHGRLYNLDGTLYFADERSSILTRGILRFAYDDEKNLQMMKTRMRQICWIFKILHFTCKLISTNRTATIRDIYYQFKAEAASYNLPETSFEMSFVHNIINHCSILTKVPRYCLGYQASSTGAFAGCIEYRLNSEAEWISALSNGGEHIIPSSAIQALDKFEFELRKSSYSSQGNLLQSSIPINTHDRYDRDEPEQIVQIRFPELFVPHFLLVVEKDAVFQQLIQSKIYLKIPCIILTGRGFPDLATRAMLRLLSMLLKQSHSSIIISQNYQQHLHQLNGYQIIHDLPSRVFGLCDWNPHGFALMNTYLHGRGYSESGLAEAYRYACPDLKIIGLSYIHDIITFPVHLGMAFTERDMSVAENLLEFLKRLPHKPVHDFMINDLISMIKMKIKYEIEMLNMKEPDNLTKEWIYEAISR